MVGGGGLVGGAGLGGGADLVGGAGRGGLFCAAGGSVGSAGLHEE